MRATRFHNRRTARILLCALIASAIIWGGVTPPAFAASSPPATTPPTQSPAATTPPAPPVSPASSSASAGTTTPTSTPPQSTTSAASAQDLTATTSVPAGFVVGSAFWTWFSTSTAAGYGQPIADQVCPTVDFCSQEFQNGTAYWKPRFGPHGVLKSSPVGLKYFADGGYATYGMPDRDNTHFYGASSIGIPESDQQGFENAIIVVPNGAAAFTLYRPKEIVMLLDPLGGSPAPQWVSPITCGLPPKEAARHKLWPHQATPRHPSSGVTMSTLP